MARPAIRRGIHDHRNQSARDGRVRHRSHLARWFKKEGDAVKRDEPLLELETDKVTVEVPSPADGAIESISAKAGATVQVGALLGAIAEGKAGAPPAAAEGRRRAQSRSARSRLRPRLQLPGACRAEDRTRRPCRRPSASPTKAASATASVAGTGRDGRVTKGDMLGALEARAANARAARRPRPPARATTRRARNACR